MPSAWLHLWAERRLYEVRQDRCHYTYVFFLLFIFRFLLLHRALLSLMGQTRDVEIRRHVHIAAQTLAQRVTVQTVAVQVVL